MPATEDLVRFWAGASLPRHRATSQHLAALHPWFAESGLIDKHTKRKVRGLTIGYAGRERSGGLFNFDEFELHRAEIAPNRNVKVYGEIGFRKSSGVKQLIDRSSRIGYSTLVTDPKGEYSPLAAAIPGGKVLKFGEDTNLFINPLDNNMEINDQAQLIEALVVTAMAGRHEPLDITQKALIYEAILDSHRHFEGGRDDATLPVLVEKLFNPTEDIARGMHLPREELVGRNGVGYKMALGLQRLTDKDLKGMFHKETSMGLFEKNTPLLVLDCSSLQGEAAVLMITLINFFTQSLWSKDNPSFHFHRVIHDEAWDLAAYPGFIQSLVRAFKLGRSKNVANWIIMHHKGNINWSGSDEAVKSLIADSAITISYRQDESELRRSAADLYFNESDIERILELPPGTAMYKIDNSHSIEVEHIARPELLPYLDTSSRVHGQTNLALAQTPQAITVQTPASY